MSLSYTFKESVSGFTRTKLSTLISIITICISLLFLGIFTAFTIHTSRFIDAMRDRVELEAFLEEPLGPRQLDALQRKIGVIEGIHGMTYTSKEDAAKLFQREFGESIFDVLEFNPLPASFKISLDNGYKTAASAAAISKQLEDIDGIESVRYRKEFLELIDTRAASVHTMTLGLGIIISLSAILLVSNTIRLAIYAKRRLIRTMELVGATRAFIRVPFLLEGMLQGILGGVLACVVLYVFIEYSLLFASIEIPDAVHHDPLFYGAVIATGFVLGLMGGIISVVRFIRTGSGSTNG